MLRYRIYAVLLPFVVAASGCVPVADVAAPRASLALKGITLPPIAEVPGDARLEIEGAAFGLLYTSESDYPFTYFVQQMPAGTPSIAPTIAEFRAMRGIPASTPVEVITLDKFFERHIERADPADAVAQAFLPRYVYLRETLRSSLSDVRVYRVGTIAIQCYVVGLDENGDLAGLTTISIET